MNSKQYLTEAVTKGKMSVGVKQMEKAVHSKRTKVPKMKSFEDFEKWLES